MKSATLNSRKKTKHTIIGEIPIDWELSSMGNYLEEITKRKENNNEIFPVLSVTNTQGFVVSEGYYGFAVNPYDEAVLDLLRFSGVHIESALLIDVNPPTERANAIWPNALRISWQFVCNHQCIR